MSPQKPPVLTLSEQQLLAYNARDIDAFCACYHEDVVVLTGEGEVSVRGINAFRERYGSLFASFEVKAWITERVQLGRNIVEKETWWRRELATGQESQGEVIVRYSEREGTIGVVEFLR